MTTTNIIADTPEAINRYQMVVVKQGLKSCKLGMRLNTAYTPKNLRRLVEQWTGRTFKARDYDGMIAAVELLLNPLPAVAVWDYFNQEFIEHISCPGEKRVRIDVDMLLIYPGLEVNTPLSLYGVFEVTRPAPNQVTVVTGEALTDWEISYT